MDAFASIRFQLLNNLVYMNAIVRYRFYDCLFFWRQLAVMALLASAVPDGTSGGKTIGNSSKMSLALVTSFAPCLIKLCGPALNDEKIGPGTAKTSRPCSKAQSAVISDPLFSAASTTKTPKLSPLIIRFLSGNNPGKGGVCGGYSDKSSPKDSIFDRALDVSADKHDRVHIRARQSFFLLPQEQPDALPHRSRAPSRRQRQDLHAPAPSPKTHCWPARMA